MAYLVARPELSEGEDTGHWTLNPLLDNYSSYIDDPDWDKRPWHVNTLANLKYLLPLLPRPSSMQRNPTMLQDHSPSARLSPPGLVDNKPLRDRNQTIASSEDNHATDTQQQYQQKSTSILNSSGRATNFRPLKASAAASDPACDNDGEEDRRPGPTTPSMEAAPVAELQWMTFIQSPQPDNQPITEEKLINEVRRIYAGLMMMEKKCIEVDKQHTESLNNLLGHQWQALIFLHSTLLHEHHDFFLRAWL